MFSFLWQFFRTLFGPITGRAFWGLTLVANSFVFLSATIFWFIERDINDKIHKFFDAFWWAFCTVSTVGYGDIVPVSTHGRAWGMITMLIGAALFASFTAIFAQALLSSEFTSLGRIEEKELNELQKLRAEMERLKKELDIREKQSGQSLKIK